MKPRPDDPPLWFTIVIFGGMLVAVLIATLAIILIDGSG